MCYFQDHADRTCSIENLLNFGDEGSPLKIFTIYRICLYISKELDFKDYIGSHYVPYKKQQIENIVTTYLESLVGSYLIAYEIYEVYAELNPYHAGTVDIILRYGIQPIGCSERFITRMVRA